MSRHKFSIAIGLLISIIFGQSKLSGEHFGKNRSPSSTPNPPSNPVLDKYIEVCSAQLNLMRQEKKLEQWRWDTKSNLQKRGFATWLEVRQARFKAESIQEKIESFASFDEFLHGLQSEVERNADPAEYQDGAARAIRVFMPGSRRLVGWLEGINLNSGTLEQDLDAAKQALKLSKQRMDRSTERLARANHAVNDRKWQRKSQLNLDLDAARFRLCQSKVDYLRFVQQLLDSDSDSSAYAARPIATVRPNSDEKFKQLVVHVANAEANSSHDLELIKRHLRREQSRLNALEELALHGHASKKELKKLQTHIKQLRSARDQVVSNQFNLEQSLVGIDDRQTKTQTNTQNVLLGKSYIDVRQWPTELFCNANHIQYIVEQRHTCYQEMAKLNVLTLKNEMLNEIIARLDKAKSSFDVRNNSDEKIGALISIGHQKELASYQWKQESLQHAIDNSRDKIHILILEEHRFLRQTILMSNASTTTEANFIVNVDSSTIWLNTLLTSMAPTTRETNLNHLRFGYIESNLLDTIGPDAELVFSQDPGFPLGFLDTHDDLLRPVKLVDYGRSLNFAHQRSVRLRAGPSYSGNVYSSGINSFRYGAGRRSFNSSNRSIAAPSLYNSPYATDRYRAGQIRQPSFFENAYPFGILRSDLRRFTNASQPPWYLPGSPNNLRSNQLRTDFRRTNFGTSGYELLNSKNYLDLSKPSYSN